MAVHHPIAVTPIGAGYLMHRATLVYIGRIMEDYGRPALFFALVLFKLSDTFGDDQSRPPKLIVVSFDGFRPDYVKPDVTPHLYNLATSGVVGKGIKSGFGTKTFPNHWSIATGLYEETHGIVHNHVSALLGLQAG